MIFKREHPGHHSSRWVECFWIVENDDSTPHLQKIIPDGFTELIFHFADPYRINLGHGWEVQSASLLAGQITKHFFLENSGRTSIFGIKLKPSAPAYIFDLSMERLNNAVVDLDSVSCSRLIELREELRRRPNNESRTVLADNFFAGLPHNQAMKDETKVEKAVKWIMDTQGAQPLSELTNSLEISERQLERLFKKYVGLSPKIYCRIIRFNRIFQLWKSGDQSWASLAYEAGYADQSHFIRNFKAFSGDDPSLYDFHEKNLANFFLKK